MVGRLIKNVHSERNSRVVSVRVDEYTALRLYHVARLIHVRPHVVVERGIKMFLRYVARHYPEEWMRLPPVTLS